MTFIQYFMLMRINKKIMSETLLVGHEEKHVLFFMMRHPVFLLSVMCVHMYISPFRHCLITLQRSVQNRGGECIRIQLQRFGCLHDTILYGI